MSHSLLSISVSYNLSLALWLAHTRSQSRSPDLSPIPSHRLSLTTLSISPSFFSKFSTFLSQFLSFPPLAFSHCLLSLSLSFALSLSLSQFISLLICLFLSLLFYFSESFLSLFFCFSLWPTLTSFVPLAFPSLSFSLSKFFAVRFTLSLSLSLFYLCLSPSCYYYVILCNYMYYLFAHPLAIFLFLLSLSNTIPSLYSHYLPNLSPSPSLLSLIPLNLPTPIHLTLYISIPPSLYLIINL